MTKTTNQIAAACIAVLLTLATFQQAIVVPTAPAASTLAMPTLA